MAAKILIVEDETQLAEAYTFLLQYQGHKVMAAENGEVALKKVVTFKPHLIILDMMMPKLDGLGFLREYKSIKPANVKIIMLSNMQSHDYETQAFKLGATRYEIKASLSPDQLLKVVNEELGRQPD